MWPLRRPPRWPRQMPSATPPAPPRAATARAGPSRREALLCCSTAAPRRRCGSLSGTRTLGAPAAGAVGSATPLGAGDAAGARPKGGKGRLSDSAQPACLGRRLKDVAERCCQLRYRDQAGDRGACPRRAIQPKGLQCSGISATLNRQRRGRNAYRLKLDQRVQRNDGGCDELLQGGAIGRRRALGYGLGLGLGLWLWFGLGLWLGLGRRRGCGCRNRGQPAFDRWKLSRQRLGGRWRVWTSRERRTRSGRRHRLDRARLPWWHRRHGRRRAPERARRDATAQTGGRICACAAWDGAPRRLPAARRGAPSRLSVEPFRDSVPPFDSRRYCRDACPGAERSAERGALGHGQPARRGGRCSNGTGPLGAIPPPPVPPPAPFQPPAAPCPHPSP